MLEGEVAGRVARTGLAMAAWAAAFSAEGDQAGGQEGALDFKSFDPGLELATDQSGMFGYLHWAGRACLAREH